LRLINVRQISTRNARLLIIRNIMLKHTGIQVM